MEFTFNMLLGHVGERVNVLAARKANSENGFSKIRLAMRDGTSQDDSEDTLYVVDETFGPLKGANAVMPSYLCICTDSHEAITSLVAELGESTSWIAISSCSPERLLNDLLDWFDGIAAWEQRARLTVAHGGSMQELIDDSVSILGLPVAVCGPLYADYTFTKSCVVDDSFFAEITTSGSLSAESVQKLEGMNVFGSAAQDRAVKVFEPNELISSWHMNRHFHSGGRQVFFATAWCPQGKPSPETIELFDRLSQFAYQLYQADRRQEEVNFGAQEQALQALLFGGDLTNEAVRETFLKLGMSSEGLWRVAVVKFDDASSVPKAYHAYQFHKGIEGSLSCAAGNEIVTLLPVDRESERSFDSLEAFAEQKHGLLGVSSIVGDLAEVKTAYDQARFAIRMGSRVSEERVLERMLGIEKDYPAVSFRFDDYLFHELLDHYPLGARGINPGKKPVFDLAAYDRQHGTQKTKFLYTYMQCNGGTGETARRMGIHRNSVGYQVKSIESILGVDMRDLGFLCHARIAFASMEVFGS